MAYAYRTRCAYATYGTCTLMHTSYGVSTLTDAHSRELTNGDGLTRSRHWETLTARPDGMPTRRDGLPAHRDGVCTQKCDNPRTSTCLYDILKAARTWLFPLGLYMLVRALVRMFHTGLSIFYFNLNLCVLGPDIYIYFIPSLFLVV